MAARFRSDPLSSRSGQVKVIGSDTGDDMLWQQLKTVPAFRALLRSVEARFYRALELPQPVLDLGCGDGHFAQMSMAQPPTLGIDPWWGPLQKARATGHYGGVVQSLGHRLPVPDAYFSTVISNSVLEHIPDIQPVLNEAGRVLRPGGKLVITMPSHLFPQYLGGAALLAGIGLSSLADRYRRLFNSISRHAHTDRPEVWSERLGQAGFVIDRWQYYFSQAALRALEWGHVQGLPSAVLHAITGHWILAPWESNLRRTERWVRPYYEESPPAEGAYLLFIARRATQMPTSASLPPARPFTEEELALGKESVALESTRSQTATIESGPSTSIALKANVHEGGDLLKDASERKEPDRRPSEQSPGLSPMLLTRVWVGLALLLGLFGQWAVRTTPEAPHSGLRWLGLGMLAILLARKQSRGIDAANKRRWHWPRWPSLSRRRLLYPVALLLAFIARSQAASQTQPGSWVIGLILWLVAALLALYVLNGSSRDRLRHAASRWRSLQFQMLLLSLGLAGVALLARSLFLTSLPFILNGTEASQGLEAVNVLNGNQVNPFSTGLFTNPTLPAFLQAAPIGVLGPSTLSIRLLSPLIGTITVLLVFWLGQALWGRGIGLTAAILLAGSHFHIHFSRVGVTNVWDAMWVLLALCLVVRALEGPADNGRQRWLLAGTIVGLNAYWFTSSHLLPLMLLILGTYTWIWHRDSLRQHWHHILAAMAMALVVATPMLVHYSANPGQFMERANVLGILESQSGWLNREAIRTGSSQLSLLGDQFQQALLGFTATLDTSPAYRPGTPLLTFGPSLLFVFGLAMSLYHWRRPSNALLLIWLGVTVVFAGALMENPPQSHRLVVATPAMALLGAIGLTNVLRLLLNEPLHDREQEPSRNEVRLSLFWPLLIGLTALFSLNEVYFYFSRYPVQHNFADRNTEIAQGVTNYLNGIEGEDWTAYFMAPPTMYVSFPTFPYLLQKFRAGTNFFDVPDTELEDLPPAPTANRTFIYLPERVHELDGLRARHPNGRLRTFSGYYANPLFYVYEVPG